MHAGENQILLDESVNYSLSLLRTFADNHVKRDFGLILHKYAYAAVSSFLHFKSALTNTVATSHISQLKFKLIKIIYFLNSLNISSSQQSHVVSKWLLSWTTQIQTQNISMIISTDTEMSTIGQCCPRQCKLIPACERWRFTTHTYSHLPSPFNFW